MVQLSLHEKCTYQEFFYSVLSHIWIEYGVILADIGTSKTPEMDTFYVVYTVCQLCMCYLYFQWVMSILSSLKLKIFLQIIAYKIFDLKYLYKYHAKPPNKIVTSEICMDYILSGMLALLDINFTLLRSLFLELDAFYSCVLLCKLKVFFVIVRME